MNVLEICVIVLTVAFIPVAMFLVIFLRAASVSAKKVEILLKEVNETMLQVQSTMEKADQAITIVNRELPQIMSNVEHTMANVTGITGQIDRTFSKGASAVEKVSSSTLFAALGVGRVVKKGASFLFDRAKKRKKM